MDRVPLAPTRNCWRRCGPLWRLISTGLNNKATGQSLHVHPNTIDCRLQRVNGLTDVDSTTAEGILRVRIALPADDMVVYERRVTSARRRALPLYRGGSTRTSPDW
ncbi:helix-turn-helix domain-containing protein [Nocardia rosealba]|uniref:helix-turn-helix domain-containing protein n=1 Tax=Nocardia rosealba TaxID=2878563 RepID=UPI0035570EDE